MKAVLALLAAALLLAACAAPLPVPPPVASEGSAVTRARDTTSFTVRSYVTTGAQRREVAGLACRFEGPGFHADFVTPAEVTAPALGPSQPAATLRCRHDGEEQTQRLDPYNLTLSTRRAAFETSSAKYGELRDVIAETLHSLYTASHDGRHDDFAYPDTDFEFGPRVSAAAQ